MLLSARASVDLSLSRVVRKPHATRCRRNERNTFELQHFVATAVAVFDVVVFCCCCCCRCCCCRCCCCRCCCLLPLAVVVVFDAAAAFAPLQPAHVLHDRPAPHAPTPQRPPASEAVVPYGATTQARVTFLTSVAYLHVRPVRVHRSCRRTNVIELATSHGPLMIRGLDAFNLSGLTATRSSASTGVSWHAKGDGMKTQWAMFF